MSQEINKMTYIILGGVNSESILIDALAYVLSEYADKIEIGDFSKIRAFYAQEYKINLPRKVIKKCVESNFISEDHNTYEYLDKSKKLSNFKENFIKKQKEVDNKINELHNIFIDYLDKNYPKIEARKKTEKKELFDKIIKEDWNFEFSDCENQKINLKFLRNDFYRYLMEKKRTAFVDFFDDLIVVSSIENCSFPKEEANFKNCVFYLDTPILLKYLGYDGKEYCDFYKTFFNELKTKYGIKLKIFWHNIEEAIGILFALDIAIKQENYFARGVDAYLMAKKYFKDISLEKEAFLNLVKENKNIEIDDKNIEIGNVDKGLQEKFEKAYNTSYKSFPKRIQRDIKSLELIGALRNSENKNEYNSFSEARYFMLTDNNRFSKISKNNFSSNKEKQCFSEILYIDEVLDCIWKENGKVVLPEQLFKARCLSTGAITDEFRDDFRKITTRLERIEPELKITEQIKNNPEKIHQIARDYISSNKDISVIEKSFKPVSLNGDDIEKSEIESLRAQLAEKDKEIEMLKNKNIINKIILLLKKVLCNIKKCLCK